MTNPDLEPRISQSQNFIKSLQPFLTVKPKNVEDIQSIILWANETQTPLIPVSSGGPHFRAGTDPAVPGALMADLSGMKRILKIDRRIRLALIEPGVTYAELQPALQAAGLHMIAPLLPRKNKSVVASLLEREPVMSPKYQWNLLEPLRSLEIVWGNGDIFYSGSGMFRGEKDEAWENGQVPVLGPGLPWKMYSGLIWKASSSAYLRRFLCDGLQVPVRSVESAVSRQRRFYIHDRVCSSARWRSSNCRCFRGRTHQCRRKVGHLNAFRK